MRLFLMILLSSQCWPYEIALITMIIGLWRTKQRPRGWKYNWLIDLEVISLLICVFVLNSETIGKGWNYFAGSICAFFTWPAYLIMLIMTVCSSLSTRKLWPNDDPGFCE